MGENADADTGSILVWLRLEGGQDEILDAPQCAWPAVLGMGGDDGDEGDTNQAHVLAVDTATTHVDGSRKTEGGSQHVREGSGSQDLVDAKHLGEAAAAAATRALPRSLPGSKTESKLVPRPTRTLKGLNPPAAGTREEVLHTESISKVAPPQ